MRIAITRIRNESEIIKSTLDRLINFFDGVVVFDDCSTDNTVEICESHPLVKEVLKNPAWNPDPEVRKNLETHQRQYLHDYTYNKYKPEWMLYLDGDEHLYFDAIDWNDQCTYLFRLFHIYITPEDKDDHFLNREMIGSEYIDIPMLFRPPGRFYNRIINTRLPGVLGGTVKHFGKGISEEHWEETCDYYINHLNETMANGESIAEKWQRRKGKAIHELSDWGRHLINWRDRYDHPDLINDLELFKQGVKPL
jgi:glycosyltransferase involved in cell wall biosynthesis